MTARTFASGSFSRHGKESDMSQLTEIPVVAQRTIDLFALFDAWLALSSTGSIMLHEDSMPGAAAALDAWAASHGLTTTDQITPSEVHPPGWATRLLVKGSAYIYICHYRDLADEEKAALKLLADETAPVAPVQERSL